MATLAMSHANGYHRAAVQGDDGPIGGRTYPVIGAVSASHTSRGGRRTHGGAGRFATLARPDHDVVHPNTVAERAGINVCDVLIRLTPLLPVRSAGFPWRVKRSDDPHMQ